MTTRRFFIIFLFLVAVTLLACRPITAIDTAVSPVPEAEYEATVFCPEIIHPAMFLLLPTGEYALFDPADGETCRLPFTDFISGMAATARNHFFLAGRTTGDEGEATMIRRYLPDGTAEALPYTMVDSQAGTELVAFTVSNDARLIAWSILGPTAGSDLSSTALFIADLETGQVMGGGSPETGEAPRVLQPIRFSEDGSRLYYALQPYGLGGMWSSYVGRYDNLYAVSSDGAGTELIFNCADLGLGLCLGDFFDLNGTVTGLAYVDRNTNTVVIQNGEGDVLNRLTTEEEYIGYPTWGPGGEFVYYTANLSDSPAPETGRLHRLAPHTAPAETIASDPALLLPLHFLNDTQAVVMWAGENENRGFALIGVEGSVQALDIAGGAALLGNTAISTLLGAGGGIVSTP